MNYRDMTTALLLLSLAAMIATIFASLIPGAWWQWLLAVTIAFIGLATASDDA